MSTPSVYFLSGDELPSQNAELSSEHLDHLFGSLAQFEYNVATSAASGLSQANLKYRAGKLRRDLEEKVLPSSKYWCTIYVLIEARRQGTDV